MYKHLFSAAVLTSALFSQACVLSTFGRVATPGLSVRASVVTSAPVYEPSMSAAPVAASVSCSVEAGPLWSNDHAQRECPNVCARAGAASFTGQWWTTRWNEMSVCQCAFPAGTHCPAVDDTPSDRR